jgi:hypothetical protein
MIITPIRIDKLGTNLRIVLQILAPDQKHYNTHTQSHKKHAKMADSGGSLRVLSVWPCAPSPGSSLLHTFFAHRFIDKTSHHRRHQPKDAERPKEKEDSQESDIF